MATLILIRHSTSQQQPGVSSHLWQLSEEGRARCSVLAEYVRPYAVQHVYSSDEPKAIMTAEIMGQQLGIPHVNIDTGLRETHRETAPYFETKAAFETVIREAMSFPDELHFGEETFSAARIRFTQSLNRIQNEHSPETVAAVTHGTILALFLAPIVGQHVFELWQQLGMPAVAVLSTPDYRLKELRLTM